ncbi:unnamed protein product [Ceutorhynchus assimilis]|uniref:Eukaryotic translation initiation factor 4E transporter-like n=1 Tax=Ceutorhynchus assimilis TaxID=467358 RepID=A0A9P0DF69_9CUCU|nr:unnamed protein product [Ceutorhynchus assimilis]
MSVGEIDPAILYVRERVKIQYSKEQLLEIAKNPVSKAKPDFLDPNEVSSSILDPEKWNLERKKSDTPEVALKAIENGDTRRRPNDPRERIRKENDGIVLSPQRRSFNTGCFVPANKEPVGGKNDPPPHMMVPGVREIPSSTRRIGSGRIMRDSWDSEKDSGEPEFGFGRGAQSRNNDREDKFGERNPREENKFERRSFGRDMDNGKDKEVGNRRNSRYSETRRRYSENTREDEPEWFSSGPISQNDTIELRGFDEPEKPSNRKKRVSASQMKRSIERAKDWNKKKEVIVEGAERDDDEPSPSSYHESGGDNDEHHDEPKDHSAGQQHASKASQNTFDFDEFLKGENIPGLLANGVGEEAETSTSRFSRWFRKDSPSNDTEAGRCSSMKEDNHIMKDLLKDLNESSSIPVSVNPSMDPNTYFAPISPAGNTIDDKARSVMNMSQSVNIMEMLARSKQPPHQQKPEGWNMKQQLPPIGGKILSLDELEANIRQNSDHTSNMHQKSAPAKPDKKSTAAFQKLLQQAGGHTASQNGPMKQPAMSLLEMLSHSQQQDEARFAAAQAQHQMLSSGLHSQQQPQQSQINDLTMKLQQAQLQQKQMDMLGKLMSAGAGSTASHMRASPLLEMGPQQSRELLNRPEAQAILQAMHQRIPSPRELQVHTQNILQRALIKKKLEEQTENFRKKQEMQRGASPNPIGNQQSGGKSVMSPTPLAFTPTSVLRKMTADKEEGKENKAVTDNGIKPQGRALTGMRQQPQVTVGNQQWNQPFQMKQAGRPIVKANNYQSQTPDQFFAQLAAQQQPLPQQRTYQAVPTAPHRKPIIGQQYQQQQASQYGQSQQQYSHPNPQSFPSQPTAQQLRAQHQHRPTTTVQPQATPVGPAVQPQPQVQQPQGPPPQAATTTQKQPMGFQQQGLQQQQTNPLWQQFFNSAAQQNSRQAGHRSQQSGALSPSTADQLTRWFSPDLLERARVGDLPSTANLARLEEIERQAAAPVHN